MPEAGHVINEAGAMAIPIKQVLNNQDLKKGLTYPGAMLMEDFLPDDGLTVSMLAKRLGVSR